MRDDDFNRFFKPVVVVLAPSGCPHCHGEQIEMPDGLVCKNCFVISTIYMTEVDPSKELIQGYKRISHFRELLFQFQAKESTTIPQQVYDLVKRNGPITFKKTKQLLKDNNLCRYYEHVSFINHHLGEPVPYFSRELEDTLCKMFLAIQASHQRHSIRKNFLNYSYVIFKFLELLDEPTWMSSLPQLKDPKKIVVQDTLWKKICGDMGYAFTPTRSVVCKD